MSFEKLGIESVNYAPCRYGACKVAFRGPKRDLTKSYGVVLGGAESYGKFLEVPYPAMLESVTGNQIVNLGSVNTGIGLYGPDPDLRRICAGAALTVIEITGAHLVSNRMYSVHPRRNDRLVKPSTFLTSLYRDVDFSSYNFVGHMLMDLRNRGVEKFALVHDELREAWMARMRDLLSFAGGRKYFLWMADRRPEDGNPELDWLKGPAFVDREMIVEFAAQIDGYTEIVASREEIEAGFERMVFSDIEEPVAREFLGAIAHERAAEGLAKVMTG